MSNRLLWILILLWFVWAWYIYYNISYLPEKKLKEDKIIKQIELEKKKEENKIALIKIEEKKNILTNKEKIKELINKEKYYKSYNFDSWDNIYFFEKSNKLIIYLNNKKIWNLDLVLYNEIKVLNILWTDDYYLGLWDKKYYINSATWNLKSISFKGNILYAKKWDKNELILVVKNWSIVYDLINNKYNLFSFFNDFVFYDEWYIWLIKKWDNRVLNNLWIKNGFNSIIVYYDPITKRKSILFETDKNIDKIYIKNKNIYLKDDMWNKYKLENIKKNIN